MDTLTTADALNLIKTQAQDPALALDFINGLDHLEARQLVAKLAALLPLARTVKTDLTLEDWCDTIRIEIVNT